MKIKNTRTKVKAKPILIEDEAEFLAICNEVALIKREKLALKGEIENYKLDVEQKIKDLEVKDKELSTRAEKFASAHREKLLPSGKSRKTALAWFGYRAIQSSVKTMAGINEGQAIALIFKLKELSDYIKSTPKLKKVEILSDYKRGKLTDEQLKQNGLRIKGGQGEEFFLDLLPTNEDNEDIEESRDDE